MGKTMADIINERKAIISFGNDLKSMVDNSRYAKSLEYTNQMKKSITFKANEKVEMREGESDEDFLKRKNHDHAIHAQIRNDYQAKMLTLVSRTRAEYMKHLVALEAYDVIYSNYKDMKGDPSAKNNPLLAEQKINLDILKAKLIDQGIEPFELRSIENKKPGYDFKDHLKNAFKEGLMLDLKNIPKNEKYTPGFADKEVFLICFERLMDEENLVSFNAYDLNPETQAFYSDLRNSGYGAFSTINVPKIKSPTVLEQAYGGYEFNDKGEMVEKHPDGFFGKIKCFFQRMMNSSSVKTYNDAIKTARVNLDDKEAIEKAQEVVNHENEIREKVSVDLEENKDKSIEERMFEEEQLERTKNEFDKEITDDQGVIQNDDEGVQWNSMD